MYSICTLLVALSIHRITADDVQIGQRTPELINHWGYPVQSVKVTTEDGYILTMHRIPHGIKGNNLHNPKPAVFLQHGLEASSSNFVTNLPQKSLGFMLADQGYDVWMGNFRGNLYSTEHQSLDVKDSAYWQFTWYHMYKYDLSAMIDKVLEMTNQSYVYYVGHSQGTLTMFAKLASEPEFSGKIKKFFALAPVTSVKHIKGLLSFIAHHMYIALQLMYQLFGFNDFTPNSTLMQMAEWSLCQHTLMPGICHNFIFLMTGPESNQLNTTRIPVFITDIPSGTSTMNVIHWMQMVLSGEMQAYNYGFYGNQQHYGQKTPPIYDLSKITTDTYLYWSAADWLADKSDIEEYLLPRINKKALIANVELQDFNHVDFLWGERAPKEVYTPIIETINADVANK